MKNAKHRKFAVALELAVINTNGHKVQHMHALAICARLHGLPDWRTLAAKFETPALPRSKAGPILIAALEQYGCPALTEAQREELLAVLDGPAIIEPARRPAQTPGTGRRAETREPRWSAVQESIFRADCDEYDELQSLGHWPQPHRQERKSCVPRVNTATLPFELAEHQVLTPDLNVNWAAHPAQADSVRTALLEGPLLDTRMPGLREQILRAHRCDTLSELDTQTILDEIFTYYRGVLLYCVAFTTAPRTTPTGAREVVSILPDRHETGIWTYGATRAEARADAVQTLTARWAAHQPA